MPPSKILIAMICAASLAGPTGRAMAADGPVFVPTFVDPQHRVEKPDLGSGRVIRFLTSDDYPPFNFTAPDGTLTGFNVDLVRALCEELKVGCSLQARSFETLVAALQANTGDAVAASLSPTPRLRAQVDFSVPTMKTPARFAARIAAAAGIPIAGVPAAGVPTAGVPANVLPDTIGALRIGVQVGTAHAAYLSTFFPGANVRTYTDPDSLRTGLKAAEIDLLFADGIATALWLNGTAASGCCQFVGGPFTESRFFGDGSAIAVRRGDLVLRQAIDYALSRLARNGTLADLYLKYFPVGFY